MWGQGSCLFISVGSVGFLIISFVPQRCIKCIKSESKDICNSDKTFHFTSMKPEKINESLFPQKYEAAQLFSTLIIRNVSWAAN